MVRLDVRGLHRNGQLMTLTFTLTNTGSAQAFGADFFGLESPYLVDPQNLKKYILVKDAAGTELQDRVAAYIQPGAMRTGFDTYAAAPSGVTALDAVFPDVGTFTATPIR